MQQTNSLEIENRNYCKNLIKQAVVLKRQSLGFDTSLSADDIMSDKLNEGLYNLLHVHNDRPDDWNDGLYGIQDLLKAILVLLGKPKVSELLPAYLRDDASERIAKLADFFEWIDTEETYALLDIESVDYLSNEAFIDGYIKYYSYDKQQLNQGRLCNNYLFSDYELYKQRFERMERLLEASKIGG